MDEELEMAKEGDSVADAVAAVSLVLIFVATCVFWLSGM